MYEKRKFPFFFFYFLLLVESIENDLVTEDFEEVIDQVTGERVLKLTAEAAARKGLMDLRDVEFETYIDPNTGKEQIRIKGGNQTGKLNGDQKFEIYVDSKTGQQRIILKRPKGRTRRRFSFILFFVYLVLFFSSTSRKIH
jgi:predicted small secreted protein